MILWIVLIITGIILTLFIIGFIWNLMVESRAENKMFIAGTLPTPTLNGIYKGSYGGTNWKGKEFDANNHTGINIVGDTKQFSFETSDSKSLHNNQQVLKLNYNIAPNPWWLRFVVDEITQTSPGKYQGKVYIQFVPGLAMAITYFNLGN